MLTPSADVADIGSGTGIFSAQIAGRVRSVRCVEPNREMREYSAKYLGGFPNVTILDGSAEATGLPPASLDAVTAAQAFHWFDRATTKKEFLRILRPGGRAALLWYVRQTAGDPFLEGYEALLLEHSIDYREVDHRNITPEIISDFFDPFPVKHLEVTMEERMDLAGVLGKIASSSYTPPMGHPNHAPLVRGIRDLFARCQRGGAVVFRYRTSAWTGRLAGGDRRG